jgi:hypothetical protein
MTSFEPRVRVHVGAVGLDLPAIVARQPGTPTDSASATFDGGGLTVLVDQGPFAPTLDADVGRPGFREERTDVGGSRARIVTYDEDDGSFTTALEIAAPHRATVVVRADSSVPRQVPLEIVRSVQTLE